MSEVRIPSGPDDLEQLVQRSRDGDAAAREHLVARCRAPLLARIRMLMGDEARREAESSDVLQETFLAALQAPPTVEFRGPSQFLNWLTSIARNRIRQDLRRRREHSLVALSNSVSGVAHRDGESTAGFDELLRLAEALEGLEARERALIERHDLQGEPISDIARQLGCSERHARRLHVRARLRLAQRLRQPGA